MSEEKGKPGYLVVVSGKSPDWYDFYEDKVKAESEERKLLPRDFLDTGKPPVYVIEVTEFSTKELNDTRSRNRANRRSG